jgi:hypothetical protein
MGSHLFLHLHHRHPVRRMLLLLLLLHSLQHHLQNRFLNSLPSLFTFGRVDGYLYYSPLTSLHLAKIRVPTLIAVSLHISKYI